MNKSLFAAKKQSFLGGDAELALMMAIANGRDDCRDLLVEAGSLSLSLSLCVVSASLRLPFSLSHTLSFSLPLSGCARARARACVCVCVRGGHGRDDGGLRARAVGD